MFYIKYLTMLKVHMHASAIRQLFYDCVYVREENPLAKARGLSPVHTHKPYNNLHLSNLFIYLFIHDQSNIFFVANLTGTIGPKSQKFM